MPIGAAVAVADDVNKGLGGVVVVVAAGFGVVEEEKARGFTD